MVADRNSWSSCRIAASSLPVSDFANIPVLGRRSLRISWTWERLFTELGNLLTFLEKRCVFKSYVSRAVSYRIHKLRSWSDRGPPHALRPLKGAGHALLNVSVWMLLDVAVFPWPRLAQNLELSWGGSFALHFLDKSRVRCCFLPFHFRVGAIIWMREETWHQMKLCPEAWLRDWEVFPFFHQIVFFFTF